MGRAKKLTTVLNPATMEITVTGNLSLYLDIRTLKHEIFRDADVGFCVTAYYATHNGKRLEDSANLIKYMPGVRSGSNHTLKLIPRLLGGKGGFGSMLRAIGAQIEKTTNRDACRDLSGRRLRDINEEQRLKKWFAKQEEREREKKESRKRKLEQLKKVTEGPALPKIDDQSFLQKREDIEDSVYAAVDEGFARSASQTETGSSSDSNSSDETKDPEMSSETKITAETAVAGGSKSCAGSSAASCSSSAQSSNPKVVKKTMFDEFESCSDTDSDDNDETCTKMAKRS